MTPKAAAKYMVSRCSQPEVAAARRECFADMLKSLQASGIRVVGTMKGAALVERNGVVWSLNDNGGEINMNQVNDPTPSANAPYTAGGFMLDGATLAYRVRCIMTGEPIDWARGLSERHLNPKPTDPRRAMWGENDAAYPGDEAWSRIVD
jgi:hypothetical protein